MKRKSDKVLNLKEIHEFLLKLWLALPKNKVCKSCGKPIWGGFKPLYFDHLLEKFVYPQYSMVEKNLFYPICGHCHTAKNNGWPTEKHAKEIKNALYLHKKGEL